MRLRRHKLRVLTDRQRFPDLSTAVTLKPGQTLRARNAGFELHWTGRVLYLRRPG